MPETKAVFGVWIRLQVEHTMVILIHISALVQEMKMEAAFRVSLYLPLPAIALIPMENVKIIKLV